MDGSGLQTDRNKLNLCVSVRHFSQLFGINRQSKYIRLGVKNRRAFDKYLQLKGSIEVGERVSCAGSDDTTVIATDADGSVTL